MKRQGFLQLSLAKAGKIKDESLQGSPIKPITMQEASHHITALILLTQLLDAIDLPNLESKCLFDGQEKEILRQLKEKGPKEKLVKLNQSIINSSKDQLLNLLKAGFKNDGKDSFAFSNFQTTLNLFLDYDNILSENFPNFLLSPGSAAQFLESLFKMLAVELIIEKIIQSERASKSLKVSAKDLLFLIRENNFQPSETSLKEIAQSNTAWWNSKKYFGLKDDWDNENINNELIEIIEKYHDVIFKKQLREKFIFIPKKGHYELEAYIKSLENLMPRDTTNFKLVTDKIGDLPEFKIVSELHDKWHKNLLSFQVILKKTKETQVPEKNLHELFLKNYYTLPHNSEKWGGFKSQPVESKSFTTSSLASSHSDSLPPPPTSLSSSTTSLKTTSSSFSDLIDSTENLPTPSAQSSSSTSSFSTSNNHESSASELSTSSSIASSSTSLLTNSITTTFISPPRGKVAEIKGSENGSPPAKLAAKYSSVVSTLADLIKGSQGSNSSTPLLKTTTAAESPNP